MLSYRSARPWLARLGLLGQLGLLMILGAAPAHAAPADHAVAAAGVVSHRAGAAASATDAEPVAGPAVGASDDILVKKGPPAAGSENSSPRTNGALLGALLVALGGLLIAVTVKLVRRVIERGQQAVPSPRHSPVRNPCPPTPVAPPPPAAAPASVVGFAHPAVPAGGGPATVRMPPVGAAVPPPAWTAAPVPPPAWTAAPVAPPGWTAPPVARPVPVGPPPPARQPGRPPRSGRRCVRCRELVPADAAYCGECGLSQQEPPFGEEPGRADRGAGRLFRIRTALRRRSRVIAGLAGRSRVIAALAARWRALAALAALVAAVTVHWQTSPMSPRDTVEAYYDALADRDADRARSLLSLNLVNRAQPMLTSGAALRNSGYHPPRHLRITRMDVRDDVGEMAGEYELDGKRQRTGLYLIRDGRGGEGRPWSINYLPGLEPPSGDYGHEALVIAGTRVPGDYLEALFEGTYVVSLPDHPIREVTAPVTVRPGDRSEQNVLRTRLRDGARESIETQVRAHLDRCAASRDLAPEGCSLRAWSPTPVKDVAWRITGYPTLEITLDPGGTARVAGSGGTATVTVGGVVLAENMSFSVNGYARAAGDKVLFVPG